MGNKIPSDARARPKVRPKQRRSEAAVIAGEDVFEWLVVKWAYEPDPEVKWERGLQLLPWIRAKPRPTVKPGELLAQVVVEIGGDE